MPVLTTQTLARRADEQTNFQVVATHTKFAHCIRFTLHITLGRNPISLQVLQGGA